MKGSEKTGFMRHSSLSQSLRFTDSGYSKELSRINLVILLVFLLDPTGKDSFAIYRMHRPEHEVNPEKCVTAVISTRIRLSPQCIIAVSRQICIRKEVSAMMKRFLMEEDAIGTVEMILILVVLIGLVIIFKTQLTSLVNKIFKTINTKATSI